ncbi:MAG: hypothetical protein FWC78_01575 [Defluviitaleaceae bacterium]|nr:hypothetical protein [Defluviitaleaceae bacterium]
MKSVGSMVVAIVAAFVIIAALIGGLMWAIPTYRVWSMEMSGRAQLAEAEFNQQVITVEARARLQAEIYNAQAEVERARGAAQAMYEVQDALSEEYILYLWVRLMAGNPNVIYIPTEGSLPILEVNRRLP